jgi:hypothetical protein
MAENLPDGPVQQLFEIFGKPMSDIRRNMKLGRQPELLPAAR